MRQYEYFELKLSGPEPIDFVRVDVEGHFVLNGKETTVKGFYAGDNTYIVRYLPSEAGVCKYHVTGVVEAKGELVCEPAADGQAWCTQRICILNMKMALFSIHLARQFMR